MTLEKERVDIKRRYNGQSLAEMLSCEVVLELLRRSGALCGDGEDDVSGLTTSQIIHRKRRGDEYSEHGFIKARGKIRTKQQQPPPLRSCSNPQTWRTLLVREKYT